VQLNGHQKEAITEDGNLSQKRAEDSTWTLWKIDRSPDEKVVPIGQAQRLLTGFCDKTRAAHQKRKEIPQNDGTRQNKLEIKE